MIKNFVHKGLKIFFEKGNVSGIQPHHGKRIRHILGTLNAAESMSDMNSKTFNLRLHPLKGDKEGLWSVKVDGNWRITFSFKDGDAYVVNYQDYH